MSTSRFRTEDGRADLEATMRAITAEYQKVNPDPRLDEPTVEKVAHYILGQNSEIEDYGDGEFGTVVMLAYDVLRYLADEGEIHF